eukprot:CAMPEP_0174252584 /NCGR_PEP_ID=MMETSP0439-20130205/1994_1 /TAXON_ID=0 /ORGANISM="Stereomyxa ramosa, Strain Chinc5" /LENGTH=234 /DNA_ID=CAMNT_0015333141 /DNA_START=51 /DNA_END=755 /DNA_ORIENTATION=+
MDTGLGEIVFLEENNHLSVVGLAIEDVPEELGAKYGAKTKRLDLSYNNIKSLTNLEKFVKLDSLVLDCNEITHDQQFPHISTLKTLSLNDNEIEDLGPFLEHLKECFPKLTYLSLLKNPACPNYFTGKDPDDYKRYRLFVVHKLEQLKFLDSSAIKDEEREEAKRVGKFLGQVARPVETDDKKAKQQEQELSKIKPLPENLEPSAPKGAAFGRSKYVYYGKQSEGNRFILNDDL